MEPLDFQAQFAERLNLQGVPSDLLRLAFTHTSYARERGWEASRSNQRLEFLGDAVLDLVLAERLYSEYPDLLEGELTKMKAAAVRAQSLARLARRLDLGRGLLLGRGEIDTGGAEKASLLADCLEALIGAVYISCGIETTRAFVVEVFADFLADAHDSAASYDHKTALQEVMQRSTKLTPRYSPAEVYGPPHSRIFVVQVLCGQQVVGRGAGPSKQAAQQEAAREALRRRDEWLPQSPPEEAPTQ
jgi:ribonuclease III